jgi:hypothetical protein
MAVLGALIVRQLQFVRLSARTEHRAGRLQERGELRIAVGRTLDGLPVDPERDDVQEGAVVDLRHIDPALDPVIEGVERCNRIFRIQAQIPREVVARSSWNADEGQSIGAGGRRDEPERAVSAGCPERVRAGRERFIDRRYKIDTRRQLDDFDSSLACPLGNPGPRSAATPGSRVYEQDRPARRSDRLRPLRLCLVAHLNRRLPSL